MLQNTILLIIMLAGSSLAHLLCLNILDDLVALVHFITTAVQVVNHTDQW